MVISDYGYREFKHRITGQVVPLLRVSECGFMLSGSEILLSELNCAGWFLILPLDFPQGLQQ